MTAGIAILGAGLTGLSAAYHLQDGYDLFEREAEPGGLCRTMERNGFLFDYTGHLLHLRQEYTRQLVHTLLPDQYVRHSRNAVIYLQDRYVNYPFQANLCGLPPEIIKECLLGFIETLRGQSPDPVSGLSFRQWVYNTFGAGVAKYFMLPYNQKLWNIALDDLSADWVSWSIPKPTVEEFVNGALGIRNRDFGYNPTFLYPKSGGTNRLPEALAARLHPAHCHYRTTAIAIDVEAQVIHFEDGSEYQYAHLISTIPLRHLIRLLRDVPDNIRDAGQQLRYVTVYDISIGVNRPNISDKHWIYFPEPEYPFYRVGFPTNFSETVAPRGCSSMYVEVSALPDDPVDEDRLRDQVCAGLLRCGLLKDTDKILVFDVVPIECGYVLYDLKRTHALEAILPCLHRRHINPIGRYGAWEYASMEDAILAGKQIISTLKDAGNYDRSCSYT